MITLIVDSTAYITKKEASDLNIRIAPVTYYVNNQVYHEIYSDCNGDFINLLNSNINQCRTSQTNVATFLSAFEEELRKGNQVLCLTLSSRLSGTYSSASIAARELNNPNIIVVDSLLTAGGLFLLAKESVKMINQGMDLNQIALNLENIRDEIMIAFTVNDMTPLRRSGRLGIVRQSVGTILNNKPILKLVEGSVIHDGTARGKNEQLKKLAGKVPPTAQSVIVHYISDYHTAQELAKLIKTNNPSAYVSLRLLGPVLGVHLGVGVIGLVWK
ncbi:MAG TPA: DegV family protein [Clostridia bacterium]